MNNIDLVYTSESLYGKRVLAKAVTLTSSS
jgi:hypothetical protein